jgi:hypothetical protein
MLNKKFYLWNFKKFYDLEMKKSRFSILGSFNQAILVINPFGINIFERITIKERYLIEANEKVH